MSRDHADGRVVAQGTELLDTDPPRIRLQKLARITLDSMVQFVGLLDAHGTVLEINKVALDAVGITLADVEGKPFWTTFWWQVSDEINVTLRASIARAAQGEFVRWDTPIFGRAGGKETIIIDASLCPVTDDQGRVVFICAEGRDITQKKAQEQEIAQKNIELSGLLERIRELDEIKTQFFANVSHELRTPLALILGPAQRLIDDDGLLDVAQRRASGQVIARNARMLLKHVNALLEMSKIEAGKLKIELQETDVAAQVRLMSSHFAVLAADRQIDFVVDAAEACMAAVDQDKLQRVLMNLLGNAFKFTPAGGRIRCALRQNSEELSVTVDDSGSGIRPELRQAVFERFRQIDGGVNRKRGGTGLGLAIAKEFVELHRGRIQVLDSDLGGACFRVTLPCARGLGAEPSPALPLEAASQIGDHSAASVDQSALLGVIDELNAQLPERTSLPARDSLARMAVPPPSGDRPVVLLVEDSPDMNRFIAQCLGGDYDVVCAFDGREGLAEALRVKPALLVTDLMMPHVSGPELIAALRRDPELASIPVLVLSAKADEELMVKLLDEGVQDFIVKPFSERELIARVRNLVLAQQARAQVSSLRDAAESANRAKDEFLAMLGHELRNPLSPILTALHVMRLRGESGSERERTVIERQVSHLTRLVDDLLDVSRIAQGRVELRLEVRELADIVDKAIEMASPLLEQRRHSLSIDVPRRDLRVEGDATRLRQVISNLLTNAAKYTPHGGHIFVRAQRVNDDVLLSVRDTGIGITPEMLPRIFELFVQERQAIDRAQGGLGIGLSIVRSLVEQHGGSVSVDSAGPGQGSEFVVRLPLTASDAEFAQVRPTPDLSPPDVGPVRVLVVDDNEDGAEMLVRALTRRGYETSMAHDAPTALRVAASFLPHFACLDIGLPVMDGYELATHLRAIPGLDALRLIAITGYGQASDRQKTLAAGFEHHLVKPVPVEAIEAVLKRPLSPPSA